MFYLLTFYREWTFFGCLSIRVYSKVYVTAMIFKLLTGGHCKEPSILLWHLIYTCMCMYNWNIKFNKTKLPFTTSTVFSIPLCVFLFSELVFYFCMLVMTHCINFMDHPRFPVQSLENTSLRRILALPSTAMELEILSLHSHVLSGSPLWSGPQKCKQNLGPWQKMQVENHCCSIYKILPVRSCIYEDGLKDL